MNLFIETQQQRAARLDREYARTLGGEETCPSIATPRDTRPRRGVTRAVSARDTPSRADATRSSRTRAEELAFDPARSRRRRMAAVLKVIALVIATPVALAVVFVAAYAFTCILNGATPDEVVVMLSDLANEVAGAVAAVLGMS